MTSDINERKRRAKIRQRAHAMYDAEFSHLEAEHKGKYLALDMNSRDYEIDADPVPASLRMVERHPVESERAIYLFRIGYPTAF